MNRQKLNIFFFLFLSFCCFANVAIAQDGKSSVIKTIDGRKFYIHTVEKSKTLYAISKIYNIDLNSLLAENPDAIDGLKNGDELKIPVKTEPIQSVTSPADMEKYNFHKVEKKETVFGICKKYKITEEQLKSMNPEIINGLKEGQLIKVGIKEVSAAVVGSGSQAKGDSSYTWHKVKDGESLYAISKYYNTTQEEIQQLNGGLSSGIKAGMQIRVKEKPLSGGAQSLISSYEINVGNAVYLPDSTRQPLRPKKTRYNVGLFLPLQTTEVDMAGLDYILANRKNFPNVSALTVDFYEGYLRAIDSLRAKDFEINTVIFDINENDSSRISSIITREEFKKLDFIIGPWYASSFLPVSVAARDLGIPIVSPTIQHNKILFQNPLAGKTMPSRNSLTEALARFCADSLRTANIFIVNNDKPKDQFAISLFKTAYKDHLKARYDLSDSLKEVRGLSGLKSSFSENRKNVYILLTENTSYLTEFFNQLGIFITDKKEITIVGNYSWTGIENLDAGYFTRYNFYTAAPFYIDRQDTLVSKLWKDYRNVYFSDPDEIYFQAYDLSFHFLGLMKSDGPDFWINLDKKNGRGAVMDFSFFSPGAETGYENRGGKILKVREYKFVSVY